MKTTKGGAAHYSKKNMKPIVTHVPDADYDEIKAICERELRSLEIIARGLLLIGLQSKPSADEIVAAAFPQNKQHKGRRAS